MCLQLMRLSLNRHQWCRQRVIGSDGCVGHLWQQIRCLKASHIWSDFSDNEENNSKRKQRLILKSGFESESEQILSNLQELSDNNTGSDYWSHWDDEVDPVIRGVKSNAIPLRSHKHKSIYDRKNYFIDCKRVKCFGGKGGDGMICFLKLFCNPMAGPSGGDGGNGGHIILEADKQIKSLANLDSLLRAESGENGMSKDMSGKDGKHMIIKVPVGTLVKDDETHRLIADLDVNESKFLAARGGQGGKGNHYFLDNINRHPKVAEIGAIGESKTYIFELKTMAHSGLVGFPNSGKSTLLSAISRAKPKVANYPFTTLNPTVGIIEYDDYEQLAVADLPGLIEGAHQNRGLGIAFLRHIERCVCLIYVIDLTVDDPYKQLLCLMSELDHYKKGLSKRPHAIVANKIDAPGAEHRLKQLIESVGKTDFRIIPISAKYGINLSELLNYFRELYDLYNYKHNNENGLIW
ncbi:mitochondrial ribosome-associated GTPase 2-like [Oppia nitens]|uniref:mitochondrial ribosome-associated GTPase 2-like n=1 Tax=Oppia nitens TaxID=1686743 RepID=UPI0023DCBAC4|nr:mitochondrial ribosome-associated GTPase 2-like [Oppia nitens]